MTQALTFNDITLTPIPHQNSLWIRAAELARALGLSREDKVAQIYQRHADEFTPEMSQLIENVVEPQIEVFPNLSAGRCRIFSLRGCHLVAMFARTPVAKAFRRWVLDVLDKLDAEQHAARNITQDIVDFPGTLSLTPSTTEDRKPLRALVGSWAQVSGLPFAACWNQLKAAFQLANIRDLPQEWIPDAITWVQKRIDALPKALPPQPERLPLYRTMGPSICPLPTIPSISPGRRKKPSWRCGRSGGAAPGNWSSFSTACRVIWMPAAARPLPMPSPTWGAMPIPRSVPTPCWKACMPPRIRPVICSGRLCILCPVSFS